MKVLFASILLFLFSATAGYAQDSLAVLNSYWKSVKETFYRRDDLISTLTFQLSKSRQVQEKDLVALRNASVGLSRQLQVLQPGDTAAMHLASRDNETVVRLLTRIFVQIEAAPLTSGKAEVVNLLAHINGVESRIYAAVKEYNEACVVFRKSSWQFLPLNKPLFPNGRN